jgi:hypothetical protein
MKLKHILQEIEDDYRGSHKAPDKENGCPLYDLTLNDVYPDDVYSKNGARYYGTGAVNDAQIHNFILKYRNKPNAQVTIFRAVPNTVKSINNGDWVAIDQRYAKNHMDGETDWHILKKKVKASEIYTNGDSWDEWGYQP